MAGGPAILVKIGADASGAVSEINRFNKALGSKLSGFDKFKAGVDKAFVPAVAALGAMGVAAYQATQKAADLAETQNKVAVIFGDSAAALNEWALAAPAALGQTQQAALDGAATFAQFGKAAGLAGSDLVEFSTGLVDLSSDIASFQNAEPADVVEALGAALRGESEPMRKYGVLLNDATLKTEALAMGIYDGTGALDMQAKILAAQAVIMKQTTDAQGDFARTSDGAANQQRILAATLEQTQTELGSALLPALESVTGMLSQFATWARENQQVVRVLAIGLAALAAAVVVLKVALAAWTVVQWALNSALLANPITWIVIAIVALIAVVVLAYNKVDWFRNLVDAAWAGIQVAIEAVVNWFQDTAWPIIKVIIDAIVAYYKFLWTIVKTVFDWIWHNAIEPFIKWWQGTAWPIVKRVVDFMVAYWKFLWEGVKLVWRGIQAAISVVVGWIQEYVAPGVEAAINIIIAVFNVAKAVTQKVWGAIKTIMAPVVRWIAEVAFPPIKKAVDAVMVVFGLLRDHISNVFNTIRSVVGSAIDWILDKISGLTSAMNRAADIIGSIGFGVPEDDPNTIHPEQVTRGRATSTSRGGGGRTVNITINGALDPVQTARQIRKLLAQSDARLGVVA